MKKYWIKRIIKYGILGLILVWATIFIYDYGRKSYEDYVNSHENDIEWIEENIQFVEDYKIDIDKGLGNINIDEDSFDVDGTYGTGETFIKVDGGVGNIKVDFE